MSILGHIGSTPLIPLRHSSPNPHVTILAKLELLNPSGSLKDRIALHMIEEAEKRGDLKPGMTIIEATSGNTGIALAMVAAVKGFSLKLFMLENKTAERRQMLRLLGSELVLTTSDDPDSHIWAAKALIAENPEDYYYVNQNENEDNPLAHYNGIGREIYDQLSGQVDAFVAGYGTGGVLMGVAKYLADNGVQAQVCAVEPGGSPRAKLDGLKHSSESYQPPIYDRSFIDRTFEVPEEEAFQTARDIASKEGILAGLSSGAVLWAAQRLAETMESGNIVVLFGDRAERYFSTRLFSFE